MSGCCAGDFERGRGVRGLRVGAGASFRYFALMFVSRLRTCGLAFAVLMSGGCVSYWHGQSLDMQVSEIKTRVEQRAVQSQARAEATAEGLDRLRAEFDQLKLSLEQRLGQVGDGHADFGLTVEALQHQFRVFEGKLAQFEHRLGGGGLPAKAAGPSVGRLPLDAKALLAYAKDKKREGDCAEASRAALAFAKQYKKHKKADDSLLLAADCLLQLGQHKASIRALRTIVTHYSDGDRVDSAMLLIHDNLMGLKRCKAAIAFLEDLLGSGPGKRIQKKAKRRLKRAKKYCKTKG